MPVVRVDGGEISFQERGRGETAVVFSQMSSGPSFDELWTSLASDYHVYALDLRAASPGQKQNPVDPWLPMWAKDVYCFAQEMQLGKFIYAGTSHGALVGWYLAATYPFALEAFVSIVGVPQDREFLRSAAVKSLHQAHETPEQRRQVLKSHFAPTKDPARLDRQEQLIDRLMGDVFPKREGLPVGPGLAFPECKTNDELAIRLAGIKVPTLILHGIYDHFTPPEMALLAAKSVPGAKAVFFQDESHFLPKESPHKVANEIKLFISELGQNEG